MSSSSSFTTKTKNCDRTIVPSWMRTSSGQQKLKLQNRLASFCSNQVSTTRYSLLTFLPQNLWEQFHRWANLYFIAIACMNLVPLFGVYNRFVGFVPVAFVLLGTAAKDFVEDWHRRMSDRRLNGRKTLVWDNAKNRFCRRRWDAVCVGDLVRVLNDEEVPADLLLLRCPDTRRGLVFVETASLDGETSLKQKRVPQGEGINNSEALVHRFSIDSTNLLLRGTQLRNASFIDGLVLYTGPETCLMLGNGSPPCKRSLLERHTNAFIFFYVLILIGIVILSELGYLLLWAPKYATDRATPFLLPPTGTFWVDAFIQLAEFILCYQTIIPLSLYIMIELIKLGQCHQITLDPALAGVECRALNIPEELGQIQYVLSDKTGTLTENRMVFRGCWIDGRHFDFPFSFSSSNGEIGEVNRSLEFLNTAVENYCNRKSLDINEGDLGKVETEEEKRFLFLLTMAVCNTVLVRTSAETGIIEPPHHLHHHQNPHPVALESGAIRVEFSGAANEVKFVFSGRQLFLSAYSRLLCTTKATSAMLKKSFSELLAMQRRVRARLVPEWCNNVGRGVVGNWMAAVRRRGRGVDDVGLGDLLAPATYDGESADELCLVQAAAELGVVLEHRSPDEVAIMILPSSAERPPSSTRSLPCSPLPGASSSPSPPLLLRYRTVAVLPFDSDRKRMSVLLEHVEEEEEEEEEEEVLLRDNHSNGESLAEDENVSAPLSPLHIDIEGEGEERMDDIGALRKAHEKKESCPDDPHRRAIFVLGSFTPSPPIITSGCSTLAPPSPSSHYSSTQTRPIDEEREEAKNSAKIKIDEEKEKTKGDAFRRRTNRRQYSPESLLNQNTIPSFYSFPDNLSNTVEKHENNHDGSFFSSSEDCLQRGSQHKKNQLSKERRENSLISEGEEPSKLHSRKFHRKSVGKKNKTHKRFLLLTKGADEAILQRCVPQPQQEPTFRDASERGPINNRPWEGVKEEKNVHEVLRQHSERGLRTLCLAYRWVVPEELEQCLQLLEQHQNGTNAQSQHYRDRSASMAITNQRAELLERDLHLLGVTAIEDKIQEGARETVLALRNAGIRVWLLTGDKLETALSVAHAVHLFDPPQVQLVDNTVQQNQNTTILSSEGVALLQKGDPQTLNSVKRSSSVLCYRMTPSEKAAVVDSLHSHVLNMDGENITETKGRKGRVLAVGDGANDVQMIRHADVGIGITGGHEGLQAAMASDFSVPTFACLRRLVLVHGHWNHYRLATFLHYSLVKNAVVVLVYGGWHQLFCGFSAAAAIDPLYSMFYPILFTSVQSLVFGILDRDYPSNRLLAQPKHYAKGREDRLNTWANVGWQFADALWQSAALYFIAFFTFVGTTADTNAFNFFIATSLFVCNNAHLAILNRSHRSLQFIVHLLFLSVHFGLYSGYCAVSQWFGTLNPPVGVPREWMFHQPTFWLSLLLGVVLALIPRIFVSELLNPSMKLLKKRTHNRMINGKGK